MTRCKASLTIAAAVCLAITARAQTPARPAWIQQAIEMGTRNEVRPYPIKHIGVQLGSFTTPFLRVAIAASEAKRRLEKFDATMVTDEMLQDALIVRMPPHFGRDIGEGRGIEHVVIKKPKSKNPDDVIQPLSEAPIIESASNAFGAKTEKSGVAATFPLSALKEGMVFYVLFEKMRMAGDGAELSITKEMIERSHALQ